MYRRAIEVAAAGGHTILKSGTPEVHGKALYKWKEFPCAGEANKGLTLLRTRPSGRVIVSGLWLGY